MVGVGVKSVDPRQVNYCESIRQVRFLWSRTKVWGSKAIRYRRSPDPKWCRPWMGYSPFRPGSDLV